MAARVGAAVLLGLLALLLTAGTASAQDVPGPPSGPQPYGGQLGRMDPGDEVSSEQVLEVGMLALGTVNGLAFAVAMVASRLRGPSAAQTRRALINRTGAGTVSESRRARRARVHPGAAAAGPAQAPAPAPAPAPAAAAPRPSTAPEPAVSGGPRGLTPQEPPAGAVPEQGQAPAPGGRTSAPVSPPAGVRKPVGR
ncbi:hypothetical protein [Actinomycetospora atypica]|uniref:Uncharacterized protein n=1 Tax=Actinomycetospora atypica TaxID=1290095 RepID=A0ABV9YWN3_9PSEU